MAEQDPDFETRDLPPGGILLFAVGLLVVLGMFFLAMRLSIDWVWPLANTSVDDSGYFVNALQPARGPNLEPNPQTGLERVMYEERTELNSYDWVDRKHGVVHIPIARAMDLIAKRGLPKHPQAEHKAQQPSAGKGAQPKQRPSAGKNARPKQKPFTELETAHEHFSFLLFSAPAEHKASAGGSSDAEPKSSFEGQHP